MKETEFVCCGRQKAPLYWWCTREQNHDGPCAAVPDEELMYDTPNIYKRAFYAKMKCDNLAEMYKLYKYTLYPIDCFLAGVVMWIFKPRNSD